MYSGKQGILVGILGQRFIKLTNFKCEVKVTPSPIDAHQKHLFRMATFVDQATHSSSCSTPGTSLREYVKELSKRPKLVVLDIGMTENRHA